MVRRSQVGLEFMISIFFVMAITAIVMALISSTYDIGTDNNYALLRDNCLRFSNAVGNCLKLGVGTVDFMSNYNLSIEGDNHLAISTKDTISSFCNLPTDRISFEGRSNFNLTSGEYLIRCNQGDVEVLYR